MARYLTITSSNNPKLGIRKETLPKKLRIGPVTLIFVTIILLCLVCLFYLGQIFTSSTKGYEMTDLEKKTEELREQNRKLEIEAAELKSYKHIEEQARQLNMEASTNIVYIRRVGGQVVVAR